MAIVVPIISTWNPIGVNKAIADIQRAEGAMGRMTAVGSGLKSIGRNMTIGITAPIAAIAYASVKTAAEFDVTMQSIRVNTGATADEMDKAKATAIKFGQDTIYSANEAADAFLELTKAGMTLDEVNAGGLASTLNLAATEGMNLADAGAIMAQTMNAFGIEAKKSGEITDILAAGAVASTATVTDLAFGLKYVSSSAAAAGIDVDDTVTALAALNNAGLTASTAGTSLNQMLVSLQAPTAGAKKIMDDLGISVTDASGELKPMEGIIADLNQKLKGMSGPERTAALKGMFNTRGMRAANILLKDGVEGWQDLNAEVKESGKAQELADARMSGMAGSLERLRGSAETAALAFGNALKPLVDAVTAALKFLLDAFTALSPGMQSAIAIFVVIVAVMGPVIWIIGAVISGIAGMMAAFSTLSLVAAIVASAFGPFILIGIAVVAVAVLIVKYWDEIVGFFKGVFDKIVGYIRQFLDYFKRSFPETFAAIMAVINFFINFWKSAFQLAFGFIMVFISAWWNAFKAVFSTAFAVIKGIATAWFSMFSALWSTIFNVIMTIIETALRMIKALFTGNFGEFNAAVKEGVGKIVSTVGGLPGKMLAAIGNLGSLLYNKGKELVQGLIDGIQSMIGSLGGVVGKVLGMGKSAKPPASGTAAFGVTPLMTHAPAQRATKSKVTININGDRDPYTTARLVKRAVEGYDISQGRKRGAPLAVAW